MSEPTDPDCTCLHCGDFCRGECGCVACLEAEEFAVKFFGEPQDDEPRPNYDDPYCPVLNRCEHCGRPEREGHKPECSTLGGTLDYSRQHKQKVKQQVADYRRQIARLEAEIEEPTSGQLELWQGEVRS